MALALKRDSRAQGIPLYMLQTDKHVLEYSDLIADIHIGKGAAVELSLVLIQSHA